MRPLALVTAAVLLAGCGAAGTTAASASVPRRTATTPALGRPSLPPALTTRGALPTPPAPPPLPPFAYSVQTVTAAQLGASWHSGCPVAPSGLRQVSLVYLDFAGVAHTGQLVVAADRVGQVVAVFRQLYAARFPIRQMVPVSAYGGSDDRSVAADNTAGFNCRAAVGGDGSWSMHAYGDAIDVDPVENPYVYGGTVDPPAGRAYLDRSDHRPGMAYSGGVLVGAFAAQTWRWGASFGDYQHFSTNGK